MDRATFFLMLAAMFAVGVLLLLRTRLRYRRFARTRARVVGNHIVMGTTAYDHQRDSRVDYSIVEFTDANGNTHRVQLSEAMAAERGGPRPAADGTIAIFYDPRDPQSVHLDSFLARNFVGFFWMAPAVLVAIFLFAVKVYLIFQSGWN